MKIELEQAVDMLPAVSGIYEKLDLKTFAIKNFKKGKQEELGMDMLFKHVFKNAKKIKPELFEIIAIVLNISEEEAKKESITVLFKIYNDIVADPEVVNFFKQAV